MSSGRDADVDMLIVGAGVTGIYQLHLAREAGYSVQLVEAGSGVGGTWYWNRYPGSRYDSESYTYGYFFSEELFKEWEWSEHFAGQAENERYFNHVVDKFDLRRHIRFNTRVTSAVWDQESSAWQVTTDDGYTARARYLVAATGVLSAPFYPNVPGRESFRGESYHTGLWPKTAVDFTGKRVAVIGTGSSGVQIIPVIAPEVASLTVYQRTPNWATPLNNRPVTPEEQAELKAGFEAIRDTVGKSASGFLHQPSAKMTFDDSPEERQAFYERVWQLGGFGKIISNYRDMTMNPAANAEWSRFVADKIRAVVRDPATAEKLIPTDHGYAGKRPPYVTDYFEAYNRPNVSLIDLKETPITAVTETGIETADGLREFDIIVWATGFDFGTGALNRIGIVGRDGLPLKEYWAGGPLTHLGIMAHHFPNFFFPGGPHGGAGNNPRYNGDQSDFIASPDRVRPRARAPGDRSAQGDGRRVDRDGQRGRDHHVAVQREELLLRHQHPRQGPRLPAQLTRAPQAAGNDGDRRQERLRRVLSRGRGQRPVTTLDFAGRVAVVTGAGRGIGRAYALLLGQRGASVVVNDLGGSTKGTGHDPGPAQEVADEIIKAGGTAIANSGDVSTVEGGQAAVDAAVDAWGRVDIVVNNAGNVIYGAMPEVDIDIFDAILGVHLRGTFNITRAAWPHMEAQNYGRVVLTGSTGMFGMYDNLSYATAKAGMIGLAQALTVNAGDHDIKINVIAPNAWTRMAGDPSKGMDELRAEPACRRPAAPGARACRPDGRLPCPRELPGQRRDLHGRRRPVRPLVRRRHRRLPGSGRNRPGSRPDPGGRRRQLGGDQ